MVALFFLNKKKHFYDYKFIIFWDGFNMVDIDELQQKEIENIKGQDNAMDEELYDLESLILDGAEARIPVIIEYPSPSGIKKFGAKLKPLTDVDVNNAIRSMKRNKGSSIRIEYLKRGLYTKDDKPFPSELIKQMYTGVATELYNKLCEISGIKFDKEEQKELMDDLMGF